MLGKIHLNYKWLGSIAIAIVLTGFLTTGSTYASNQKRSLWTEPSNLPLQGINELNGESLLPFLFAAYLITWAAFFTYALLMSLWQRDLKREVKALRMSLDNDYRQTSNSDEASSRNQTSS